MLKHEEMIENVHRRISQYEEEQKMKKSKVFKLFSAKQDIKTEENRTNKDEYIEVASGTDHVRTSNNVLRMISSVAAAAILFTGVGATGYLMHRNKMNNKSDSENEAYLTESTESNLIKQINDNSAAPFADFNKLLFTFSIFNQPFEDYSDDTYNRLAAYLNSFDWGEGSEIAEKDIPDFNVYEGEGYGFGWKDGDIYFHTYVTEDGKAYYLKTKCTPDNGSFYYPVLESSVFDIDYEAFDKGMKDILSGNVPNTDEYLSQREKRYLTQGVFLDGMVEKSEENDYVDVTPENPKSFNALQGFLREDFVDMLQKDKSIGYDSDDLIYTVACYYKTNSMITRRLTYYISGNGAANLCEYDLTETDSIPTGCTDYYIDIKEFETVLNDIFSGKYDNKYSVEVRATSAAVTTSVTTTVTTAETTAVTTAEQVEPPQEEPEEKEPTDADLVREFYLAQHDGHDGSINGTYEGYDENGNWVDYKNEINFMLHKAEIIPFDRVLGEIINEEDAIAKGREVLLNLRGQDEVDYNDREYIEQPDGTRIIRDNPCYRASYYEDYDIWVFHPTLFSGSSEDGKIHIATPGSVPFFYIRGCDGKLLAYWG